MNGITRLTCCCFALVVSSSLGLSQPNPGTDQPNLYSMALFASIDEMSRQLGHIDDSYGNRIRTNYRHRIVEKTQITEKLPDRSGEYEIEYLDVRELIDRYHKLRKEFAILVVFPMTNEGTHLKIGINIYWFEYKHRKERYGLEGGSEAEFHYDCEKQAWVLDYVKLWGVWRNQ